jgi:hypothetical protein
VNVTPEDARRGVRAVFVTLRAAGHRRAVQRRDVPAAQGILRPGGGQLGARLWGFDARVGPVAVGRFRAAALLSRATLPTAAIEAADQESHRGWRGRPDRGATIRAEAGPVAEGIPSDGALSGPVGDAQGFSAVEVEAGWPDAYRVSPLPSNSGG